jgi:phospholipase C
MVFATAVALTALATPAQGLPIDGIHNIQHVVIIMQENRSFDSYFGTYPGADGIPHGTCVPDPLNGGCVKPFHNPELTDKGGPHGTHAAEADIDGGKMDGFIGQLEKEATCEKTEPECPQHRRPCRGKRGRKNCNNVVSYHDAREIPNYWTYAGRFVLQDHMFESVATWSLPEHLYMVSGWSAICPYGDTNPFDCVGSTNPSGGKARRDRKQTYAWTDITYLLARAHVSWNYYVLKGGEPDCELDESIACEPIPQSAATPGIWNPLLNFTDVKDDNSWATSNRSRASTKPRARRVNVG